MYKLGGFKSVIISSMKYWLAAVLILAPATGFAAVSDINLNQVQIPGPVQDLFQTFGQIHIDVGQNQAVQSIGQGIQETVSQIGQDPQNWLSQLQNWWGRLNSWLQINIGVSFSQILTVIANLFIWVFELMIKLIKLALPSIQ
ncbi:MAG: hypothetical protein UY23_C0002G0050 [Candidatus Jorgensenbacteria bacterium GW2011_GWA1_48_11]|uniref:Uncharacterized protein n=1 Tax=Candidatus Jorgensenbacteria bacterium GW2011_GWA1_48_11 TaxID=1618660 RepID=A0A0G1UAV8_9BACT|nr:MAG: hypothetical protein UY23_C0002G0050 [Candidatus Jorgensenbacteria bacterium GW2011_GWA1_48_11]KKW12749.1 MAG: hypothetical protein UY51_C0001G0049 [Candidatus Jorgensenbacteria bacterium GW2011_GWB1_49_9]